MKTTTLLSRLMLLLLSLLFYIILSAQALPLKQWDKTFGGIGMDELRSLQQTSDGGYILGGSSISNGGDKTEFNKGLSDFWIIKLDASGTKQWDKTFGGRDDEYLFSLQQTSDGGYILGGYSNSNIGGDKTGDSKGFDDYWIIKIDASGNKQWDRTFGGSDIDKLNSLRQTSDGGYILGGYSASGISGDKTENKKGGYDYWIVKIDASGNKQWDKTFGGSDNDELFSMRQTLDGGYILGGYSLSGISGDKSENSQGSNDYWIVKITSSGNKQWDKTLGGNTDDKLYSLQQTADGGYILGGISLSGISGDKTAGNKGSYDYWVVKIDASSNKQWDKTFGGSNDDELYSLQQTSDGGYILGGYSYSGISGDKTEDNRGITDYWLVKTDGTGNKQWDKIFGGSSDDKLYSLQQTSDKGYILGGYSVSGIGGDKTENNRGGELPLDYWVVKVSCSLTTYYRDSDGDGFGDNSVAVQDCSAPTGYVATGNDCNDNDAAINPNTIWVIDNDHDNHTPELYKQCQSPGPGWFIRTNEYIGDCNDSDATIYDGAPELCDGIDNNCNGVIDEGVKTFYYRDADGDGFGDYSNGVYACSQPEGYITYGNDCDDSKASVHPGAKEICGDGIDNNCDGVIDENCTVECSQTATNPNTTNITSNSATLNWSASANPTKWVIQYKKVADTVWTSILVRGSLRSTTVSSLDAKQKYVWHIRAKCSGGIITNYTNKIFFKTLSAPFAAITNTQQSVITKNETPENAGVIKLYPNPTGGQFTVELHLPDNINANARIELVNMIGQTVYKQTADITNGKLQKNVSIPSSLSQGIYTVKITANNKTYYSKLIYEK